MKRTSTFVLMMILLLTLSLVPANVPARLAQAQESQVQEMSKVYLPAVSSWQLREFERFQTDPGWAQARIKDPKDGFFEHSPGNQSLLGHVTDNSAMIVTWPGWRVHGDYKIEVTARHVGPMHKSFNGLGLVFNATDDFQHFYALMLAMGAAQNFWALVRFDNTRATYETNDGYRGGPNFMKDWDGWNELEVRVVDGYISVYCNDKPLPGRTLPVEGKLLADNRLVGLVATSYEFDNAEVEYDNFVLTPLYPGDPDYEEAMQMRETRAALETLELDTPALDLH